MNNNMKTYRAHEKSHLSVKAKLITMREYDAFMRQSGLELEQSPPLSATSDPEELGYLVEWLSNPHANTPGFSHYVNWATKSYFESVFTEHHMTSVAVTSERAIAIPKFMGDFDGRSIGFEISDVVLAATENRICKSSDDSSNVTVADRAGAKEISEWFTDHAFAIAGVNSGMKRYAFKSDSSVIVRAKPMTAAEYNAHMKIVSLMMVAVVPSNDVPGYLVDAGDVTARNTTIYPGCVQWVPKHYFVENYDELAEEPSRIEAVMTTLGDSATLIKETDSAVVVPNLSADYDGNVDLGKANAAAAKRMHEGSSRAPKASPLLNSLIKKVVKEQEAKTETTRWEHDMTTYIGTKIVNAKPMNRGEFNCFMEGDPAFKPVGYINGASADDKGYLVEYLDGGKPNKPHLSENYLSWSPADVFEKAYKVVQPATPATFMEQFQVDVLMLDAKRLNLKRFTNTTYFAALPGQQQAIVMSLNKVMRDYSDTLHCATGLLNPVPSSALTAADFVQAEAAILNEVIIPGSSYIVEIPVSRGPSTATEMYLLNTVSAQRALKELHALHGGETPGSKVYVAPNDVSKYPWLLPTAAESAAGIIAKCNKPALMTSFGDAIAAMEQGKRVARSGWNGKGMWITLVTTVNFDVGVKTIGDATDLLPWIGMKTADNKFVPWQASQADMLAKDWIITN